MTHSETTNTPLPTYVFGLIGQSNMEGTNARWQNVADRGVPEDGQIPNAFIWDRIAQEDRYSTTNPASLRKLTPGYANGLTPPWAGPENDYFGPEMSFAMTLQETKRARIVIIKLAVGGSQVADNGGMNWNHQTTGRDSLLNCFLQGYWSPGFRTAQRKFPNAELGGIVSMVGTSDARHQEDAESYASNMAEVVKRVRKHIRPQSPNSVPWLVIKSPRYVVDGEPIGFIDLVRSGQDRINALEFVTTVDLDDPEFYPSDFLHLNEVGLLRMGRQMATWGGRVIDSLERGR